MYIRSQSTLRLFNKEQTTLQTSKEEEKKWNYFQFAVLKKVRKYEIYFRVKFKLQRKTDNVFGNQLYGILLSKMIHSLKSSR